MTWNPKQKAIAFAASLLLVSTIFLGGAAATTGSSLRPFLTGQEYGEERSMTRGHHVALGLRVGQLVGDEVEPLAGAQVTIARPGTDEGLERTVMTKATNDRGAVVFELRPGAYKIAVTHGTLVATNDLRLRESARLSLVFDEEGNPHWMRGDHHDMERRGDYAGLLVRVAANESGRGVPVPNATVEIFRMNDGEEVLVDSKLTGPRGFAEFHLHKGRYLVRVSVDDVQGEHGLPLDGPKGMAALIDGDEIRWRVGDMPRHGSGGH